MGDNRFIRIFIPVFSFALGILAGAAFFQGLSKGGIRQALLWMALLVVAGAFIMIRAYSANRRKKHVTGAGSGEKSEVGFVVDTFQDVVARLKEKEDELRRLKASAEDRASKIEAYNENILQSVPSGVISIDKEGLIRSVNNAAGKILGINAENVLQKRFSDVLGSPLSELTGRGRLISREECQYTTHDGRNIWLGITSSALRNSEGEKIGTIFVFTDLTDIKQLRQQVELRNRLSQLGEVSAGIAHELRNAMSVVTGYARLLRNKVDSTLEPTAEAIISEIRSMDRVITDLLAFARPTVINREDTDLAALMEKVLLSSLGDDSTINVSLDIEEGLSVPADASMLRQAFSNLCRNAREAMPDGGSINIRARKKAGKVEITFTDTGSGIPADAKEKVFLPFFTTRQEGTGLGLAIVQKIILAHEGIVEIDDAAGGGTVFRISLPGRGKE
jgi:PAS domain S-box-containing protein